MKKLLLMLISLCGVLTACHRLPPKSDTYTPIDTVGPNTPPTTKADSSRIQHHDQREYKLLYGVRPTPFEQKKMAEDTLRNAKE